jgi:PIN domain nuclease of toxin-antitoxin system
MKKILLDTHILIWFFEDNHRLSKEDKDLIIDSENIIYFSSVSIAEMAIKTAKNKLNLPDNFLEMCYHQDFIELPLMSTHSQLLNDLSFVHLDPFDRLLIVQAQAENLYLMTKDSQFLNYNVKLIN